MHAHARTARTAPHTDMQALAAAEARQAKFAHNWAAANKADEEAAKAGGEGFVSTAAKAINIVGAGVACARAAGVL